MLRLKYQPAFLSWDSMIELDAKDNDLRDYFQNSLKTGT